MHRLRSRRLFGTLLVAAGLLAGAPLAQAQAQARAQEPDLAVVAGAVDLALDGGDGHRVLTLLADAVGTAPGRAADLAAIGTRLAPWMAADVAVAVLTAVPVDEREAMASQVLAAVLTAGQGRLGAQVLAAVGRAVPQADPVILQDLADRLSVDGVTAADSDLVLADLAADGAPAPMLGAVRRARQADLDGRQVISRLPPQGRQGSGERSGLVPPDLTGPVETGTVQPRLTEWPRLPDPRQTASPS